MLKKLIVSFLFIIGFSLNIHAEPPGNRLFSKDQEIQEMQKIIKVMDYLSQNKKNDVWDGYDFSKTPVIIKFESGSIYAINFKSPNPVWKPLSLLNHKILFSDKDLWGLKEVFLNPSFPIENQNAFVFQYDADFGDPLISLHTFIHERFHNYQFDNFEMNENDRDAGYDKQYDAENLALINLEEKILLQFLKENKSEKKKEYLKDFVAIHAEREIKLDPKSIDWESHQQKMEGLADYVSFKMFDSGAFLGSEGIPRLIRDLEQSQGKGELSDRAVKWRHYGVGASLGYALDFLSVKDWKREVMQGKADLASLLEKQFPLKKEELNARVEKVKRVYQYQMEFKAVSDKIHAFLAKVEKVKRDYQSQSGIPVVLGMPAAPLSGGGENEEFFHIEEGSVFINDTSFSSTTDNNWQLNFNHIPYIFELSFGEKEFKMIGNTEITIDNRKYTLNSLLRSPMKKPFKAVSWNGVVCQFNSKKFPGMIISDGKKLSIRYERPSPA